MATAAAEETSGRGRARFEPAGADSVETFWHGGNGQVGAIDSESFGELTRSPPGGSGNGAGWHLATWMGSSNG